MSHQARETGTPTRDAGPVADAPAEIATEPEYLSPRLGSRLVSDPRTVEQFDVTIAELHRASDCARAEIARADAKAGLLGAIAIPIAGILLAAPSFNSVNGYTLALAWTAAAFIFIGVGYLGSVVWPQLRGNVGLCFISSTPPDRLVEVVIGHSLDPAGRRTYAAVESNLLARLATTKFRRIQRAILWLGVGSVLIFVTSVSLMIPGAQ